MKNMLDTSKFFNKTLESTKRRVVLVLMLLFTIVYAGQANAQSKKVTIVTSGMTIRWLKLTLPIFRLPLFWKRYLNLRISLTR